MGERQTKHSWTGALLIILAVGIMLAWLIACDNESNPVVSRTPAQAIQTPTSVLALRSNTAMPTSIPTSPTKAAPPATPTPTQISIPEPTATMDLRELGISKGFGVINGYAYDVLNQWRGVVGDDVVTVSAAEGLNGRSDPNQGYVILRRDRDKPYYQDVYETPARVGGVYIMSANGTSLVLTTTEPCFPKEAFVFNAATRQFVPPTTPTPTPQMGILAKDQVCNHSSWYAIVNSWRGVIDGEIGGVVAGANGYVSGDTNQGIVVVYHGLGWTGFDFSDPIYSTPTKSGPVHIVSVNGTRFTVANEDGSKTFVFDLATRKFTSPKPLLSLTWMRRLLRQILT